ncbi:MAG: hypothetical protein HPY50_04885 [Firmicutes bacterium]|nr:hypothetical protein [Bacillota bacterium]
MAFTGDTVRLTAEFKDWNGELADPEVVTVKIYENQRNVIHTGTAIKSDIGKYYYDYELPTSGAGDLVYEFGGVLGGKTVLARAALEKRFV